MKDKELKELHCFGEEKLLRKTNPNKSPSNSKKLKEKKCKHQWGWFIEKKENIYVFSDGVVVMGDTSKSSPIKLEAKCNNPSCNKRRNIYIKAKVIKWGTSND